MKATIFLAALCHAFGLLAQPLLTAKEAVQMAVAKEFQVLIAQNELEMARLMSHPGMAGMLPELSLAASGSLSSTAIDQTFSNGLSVAQSGVRSDNLAAQAIFRWTLFDGFQMFRRYSLGKTREDAASMALKVQVETLMEEVYTLYFQIAALEQQLRLDSQMVQVWEEQIQFLKEKERLGAGVRQEVLQAQLDLNTSRSNLWQKKGAFARLQAQMNSRLQRNPETPFTTETTTPLAALPPLEGLKADLRGNNAMIQQSEIGVRLARDQRKLSQGVSLPTLTFQSTYGYNRTANTAGFALFNQSNGPQFGLVATQPLFMGWQHRTQVKVRRLEEKNAEWQVQQVQWREEGLLVGLWYEASSAYQQYQLEETNFSLAEENLQLADQLLRLGKISGLQFREAQKSLSEAGNRKAQAWLTAQQRQINLLRVAGQWK